MSGAARAASLSAVFGRIPARESRGSAARAGRARRPPDTIFQSALCARAGRRRDRTTATRHAYN